MTDLDILETRVERERESLARSLDALSETVNPSRLAQQATAAAEGYGGELGQQAWAAARRNPVAFALVGAGVSLLLSGTGARPEKSPATPIARPPEAAFDGFDERVAKADDKMKQEMTGMIENRPNASRLRQTLRQGLDHLPPAARKRVLKARNAALKAQEKVEAEAKRAARKTQTFAHEQPLAVGALAMGIGALIGGLLPNTRREDALLGEKRDMLMREAEHTLRSEMAKLHMATKDGIDELTSQRRAG